MVLSACPLHALEIVSWLQCYGLRVVDWRGRKTAVHVASSASTDAEVAKDMGRKISRIAARHSTPAHGFRVNTMTSVFETTVGPCKSSRERCMCYHTVGTLISTLTLALLFPLGRLVSLVSHWHVALTRSHSRCPRIHRRLECSPSRYVVTTAQSSVRESRIGKIMSLTVVHVMHFFAGCDAQDVDRYQGPRNFRVFPPHFLSKNIHSRIDLINRIPTALRFSGEGGGDRYE